MLALSGFAIPLSIGGAMVALSGAGATGAVSTIAAGSSAGTAASSFAPPQADNTIAAAIRAIRFMGFLVCFVDTTCTLTRNRTVGDGTASRSEGPYECMPQE